MSGRTAKARRRQQVMQPKVTNGLARSGRAGRDDLAARAPWMSALKNKKVALFGVGAIGCPAALELARCGLHELAVLDGDYLDPATACRWPLGIGYAGSPKVGVVQAVIGSNWPLTHVHPELRQLGRIRQMGEEPEGAVLERMLQNANLVVDATAEYGVSFLLSELARDRNLPYVAITAEHGVWGGTVLVVRPGKGGCWMCYQAAVVAGDIPRPPSDPAGLTQPEGCAAPTFSGASFELLPIVAEGVRAAVSILTAGEDVGYAHLGWDVAVGSLRTTTGQAIPWNWQTFQLRVHSGCPRCGQ